MMKIFQFSLYKILILFFLIFFVIACSEYDVASPQWDQDFEDVPIPIITSVSPADIAPGLKQYPVVQDCMLLHNWQMVCISSVIVSGYSWYGVQVWHLIDFQKPVKSTL